MPGSVAAGGSGQKEECGTAGLAEVHTEQQLDTAIKTALECPCVKDLREGPCGPYFAAAFTCFHRSTDVIKGADCFHVNVAFAECIESHPEVTKSMKGGTGAADAEAVVEMPHEQLRVNLHAQS